MSYKEDYEAASRASQKKLWLIVVGLYVVLSLALFAVWRFQ